MSILRCCTLPSVLPFVIVASLAVAQDAIQEKNSIVADDLSGAIRGKTVHAPGAPATKHATSQLRKRVERLEKEVERLKARLEIALGQRPGGTGGPAGDRKQATQPTPNAHQLEIDRLRELGAKVTLRNGKVVKVNLTNSTINDTDMELIGALTTLENLTLNGCRNLTDAGLAHLKPLTGLKGLALERTNITDAGLENLKGMTELGLLSLNWTRVGDTGLKHLANLRKIGVLYLCATQTADEGVASLKNMAQLSWLDLRETQVTDAGLNHLSGLSRMRLLCLYGIPMTDAGIEPLTKLSNLHQLTLNQTQVTDAGLLPLAKLTKLRELNLRGAKVTEYGVSQVQRALPKCRIDYQDKNAVRKIPGP